MNKRPRAFHSQDVQDIAKSTDCMVQQFQLTGVSLEIIGSCLLTAGAFCLERSGCNIHVARAAAADSVSGAYGEE